MQDISGTGRGALREILRSVLLEELSKRRREATARRYLRDVPELDGEAFAPEGPTQRQPSTHLVVSFVPLLRGEAGTTIELERATDVIGPAFGGDAGPCRGRRLRRTSEGIVTDPRSRPRSA